MNDEWNEILANLRKKYGKEFPEKLEDLIQDGETAKVNIILDYLGE